MSYASEVLADSPLLYVRFEEPSGATCANIGSLGGNATAAGTFTRNVSTGLAGPDVAIDLDGTTGIVTYPDNASLDLTGDVTYECWFNADTLQGRALMSKGSGGGSAGYELQLRATGDIRVLKSATTFLLTSDLSVYSAGSWFHVAFTRSGNNYVLYLNGASIKTATDSTVINATSELFGIGSNQANGVAGSRLDGKIDEAAVYGTALSAARIAAHYAARNDGGAVFVPQIAILAYS